MAPPLIRRLTLTDAPMCFTLRLRGLRESPRAFGETAEHWASRGVDYVQAQLAGEWATEVHGIFGAFGEAGSLNGMVRFHRVQEAKHAHLAHIYSMYVAPEARGAGLGRLLLTRAIEELQQLEGVIQIGLGVAADNEPAKALYAAMGFEVWGVEPRSTRIGDEFVDEEFRVLHLDGYRPHATKGPATRR